MKKTIIFMMVFCLMAASVIGTTADFSQQYMQPMNYWLTSAGGYGFSTENSELLRSTSQDTYIDYTLPSWTFCSVPLAAGQASLGVTPISISDAATDYKHRALIATYNDSIVQYSSDCSAVDTYSIGTNRTIVSKLGAIGPFRDTLSNDYKYTGPSFAVVNYNNYTGYTYFTILTLDLDSSDIILDKDILLSTSRNFTDPDKLFGVAGGCYSSNVAACEKDDRVFAIFNADDDKIDIIENNGNWLLRASVSTGETYADKVAHNNMLFFRDWDADGLNEFLIMGFERNAEDIYVNQYQPLTTSPYYVKTVESSQNQLSALTCDEVNAAPYLLTDYQGITPCQIGDIASELELCFSFGCKSGSPSDEGVSGILLHNLTLHTGVGTGPDNYFPAMSVFTADYDDDNNYEYCIKMATDTVRCYDETRDNLYNITVTGGSSTTSITKEVILTEIDGDTDSMDLLLSDGNVYHYYKSNGSSSVGTDWSTFTSAYHGQLIVQPLSEDDIDELVYFDSDVIRIYSNDPSALSFMNFTEENESVTTVTSSTTTTTLSQTAVNTNTAEEFVSSLNDNISFIIGMILIIGIVVIVAMAGVTSPIILLFVGLVGAIMVSLLGLISTAALILVIMVFVVLIFLAFTVFNNKTE